MISLGRISAAYGIKGWLKVWSYTDPLENITSYQPWYLKQKGSWQEVKVINSRRQGKGLIAQLEGCETRDDVDAYIGKEIAVPGGSLASLAEGEYYWSQLEGLTVLNTERQVFGVIDHILETGANDVIVVKATAASIDEQERLIPYLKEKVIKSVSLETGEIIIDWDASW